MNNLNTRKVEIDMNLTIITESDLMFFPKKNYYIAHQCNCVGRYGGLAGVIAKKYPDIKVPADHGNFGTISVHGPVINMYSQLYTGIHQKVGDDSESDRHLAFRTCLLQIGHLLKTQQEKVGVAFPYMIGCGLAQGDWKVYFNAIWDFSKLVHPKYKVLIVKVGA